MNLGFPILSLIVFLPLIGAVILALFVRTDNDRTMRGWALAVMVVDFLLSLVLLMGWQPVSDVQYLENASWIPRLGIGYTLGVDGISLFFVLLTTFIMPVALYAGVSAVTEKARGFLALMLLLETAVLGVFTSLDLVLFFIFWEAMLIPVFFLIGIWGGKNRRYATNKFFLYTMAGSALMLVGILFLAAVSYRSGAGFSFNLLTLQNLRLDPETQLWLFGAFALAFAVKAPVFPFHTWLPDAYYESPTALTAFMAAVLSKMGIYGFLRLCLPLFPQAAAVYAPIIAVLAIIGIVYGSLLALAQKDAKMMIAYSSLAHISLIVLGVFALRVQTTQGVLIQVISHGLNIAILFLMLGMLLKRRGTLVISELGGLWKLMPTFGVFFLIAMFAAVGLPGLNGFVGEFVILTGVFQANVTWAVFASLGIVLGAWYMLNLFRQTMQGPLVERKGETSQPADLTAGEKWALVPIIILIFLIGLVPNLVFGATEPSAAKLMTSVQVTAVAEK